MGRAEGCPVECNDLFALQGRAAHVPFVQRIPNKRLGETQLRTFSESNQFFGFAQPKDPIRESG